MGKKLLAQIFSLLIGSVLVGVILHSWGINYIIGGLFGIALQFVGFYAFKTILTAVVGLKNKQLENERLKELSHQGLEVTCPCFKNIKEFVPIKLNSPNYYKCSECKKTIGIVLSPETAIVTEPQDSSLEAINTLLTHTINKQNANT